MEMGWEGKEIIHLKPASLWLNITLEHREMETRVSS